MTVLAKLLFHIILQQVQHLQDHSSECLCQLFFTIGLPQGGHVHKRRSAFAQVQRCVVGVVTQVSNESQNTRDVQQGNRENPYLMCDVMWPDVKLSNCYQKQKKSAVLFPITAHPRVFYSSK